MATEQYQNEQPMVFQPEAQVSQQAAPVTINPIETKPKEISLMVDTPSGLRNVPLKFTRSSIVNAERQGILNMSGAEHAPIAFLYALTLAAVRTTIPNATQTQVDNALDVFLDEKDENGYPKNSFKDLSDVLIEQYTSFFGIGEDTVSTLA